MHSCLIKLDPERFNSPERVLRLISWMARIINDSGFQPYFKDDFWMLDPEENFRAKIDRWNRLVLECPSDEKRVKFWDFARFVESWLRED